MFFSQIWFKLFMYQILTNTVQVQYFLVKQSFLMILKINEKWKKYKFISSDLVLRALNILIQNFKTIVKILENYGETVEKWEFTKILLLSETYQRPIGDRDAWSETHRRHIGDRHASSKTSTCFIGETHLKPTCPNIFFQ